MIGGGSVFGRCPSRPWRRCPLYCVFAFPQGSTTAIAPVFSPAIGHSSHSSRTLSLLWRSMSPRPQDADTSHRTRCTERERVHQRVAEQEGRITEGGKRPDQRAQESCWHVHEARLCVTP
jgi:hypothetical protein